MRRTIAIAAAVLAGGPAFGQAQDDSSPLGTRPKLPYVVPAVPQVKPPTPYVFRIRDRATAERAAGGPRAKNYWALQRIAREKAEKAAATRGPSVTTTAPGRTSDGLIPGTQIRTTGNTALDAALKHKSTARRNTYEVPSGFVDSAGMQHVPNPIWHQTTRLPNGGWYHICVGRGSCPTPRIYSLNPVRFDRDLGRYDGVRVITGVDRATLTSAADAAPAYEPQEPATDLERAYVLLAAERSDDAIAALRAHLEGEPDDVRAMRLLGLVLIESGRVDDGVAMVMLAYRTDPMLPHTPPEGELFGPDRLHRVLILAVRQANQMDLAAGWVTVASVMQAEGRQGQALRMVERARALGLDGSLVSEFRAALTPGG